MPLWLTITVLALGADPTDLSRVENVLKRSDETIARLEKEGASWTARHQLSQGWFEVAIERYPTAERFELRVVSGKRVSTIATVIASDEHWYVSDGQRRAKYRAYEAPLPIPTGVFFYSRSNIMPSSQAIAAPDEVISVEELDGQLVTRRRIPAAQRQTFEESLKKLESLEAELKADGGSAPAEAKVQLENVKEWMTKGLPLTIDSKTGIVLEVGQSPRKIHFRDFTWKGADRAPWTIKAEEWEDHSEPWTAKQLQDVIQIGHNPLFRPGMPGGDTDSMLLNVVTGEFRRLPYPYGLAASGAFSPDRTRAFVAGTAAGEGGMLLFEVDLRSGNAELLGGESLERGIWFGPVVSPDGGKLAAVQILQGAGLKFQPYVIDLSAGACKPIGEPLDLKPFAWSPEGKSLYCEIREPDPDSDYQKSFISSLSLDGKVRKIREGKMAVLLPKSRRFLFESGRERTWQTCDLDGKNARIVGDGLPAFSFPAPSKDDRLIMMKFEKGKSPQPHLVDVDTGEAMPIDVPPGLWASPRWQ